jgi:hypothetical protein
MRRSEVMYQVCDVSPNGEWEPLGLLFNDRTQGEQQFRRFKRRCPSLTAFLARVVSHGLKKRCRTGDGERFSGPICCAAWSSGSQGQWLAS